MTLRTSVAMPEHVEEAFRLFNVSIVDTARSVINEHLNLSPEIANEIKVNLCNLKSKNSVI
jgi:DNA replication licensing factor MCM5